MLMRQSLFFAVSILAMSFGNIVKAEVDGLSGAEDVHVELGIGKPRILATRYHTWNTIRVGRRHDAANSWTISGPGTATISCSKSLTGADLVSEGMGCQNVALRDTTCTDTWYFLATAPGPIDSEEVCNITYDYDNPAYPDEYSTDTIVRNGWAVRTEPGPKCALKEIGSEINIDAQTVTERIPVIGSDFDLVYSSAFANGYPSAYGSIGQNSFAPERLVPSVQHLYFRTLNNNPGSFYMGTGQVIKAKQTVLPNDRYQVVDDSGDKVYIFDGQFKHLETKSALTGVTLYSFAYDNQRYLTSITDRDGKTTTFVRANGKLTSVVSPYGQVTNIYYPPNSRMPSQVSLPSGASYFLNINPSSQLLTSFTKPGGQTTTFTYAHGRLTKDTGAGGNFWQIDGDRNFSTGPLTKRSAIGRETVLSREYDTATGQFNRTATEPSGLLSVYKEETNGSSMIEDQTEKVTSIRQNDVRFGIAYQSLSSVERLVNGINDSMSVTQTVSPTVAPATPFSYSTLTTQTVRNGKTSTSVFNKSSMTYTRTSPAGIVSVLTLNSKERPISSYVGDEIPVTTTYDANGKVSQVIQGTQNGTFFDYNLQGFLSSVSNLRGETTSFSYNSDGQLTTTTLPDYGQILRSYDSNGNLTSITPPGRPAHIFTHNLMELISTYQPPILPSVLSPNTTYAYNLDKQLTSITRPDGQQVNYSYGAVTGLLNSIDLGLTGHISYGYLPNTPLVSDVSVTSDQGGIKSLYTYFGKNIKSQEQRDLITDFSYGKVDRVFDVNHRVIERVLYGNDTLPVSSIPISYDDDGRPTLVGSLAISYSPLTGRNIGSTLDRISDERTYDSFGNLSSYTAYFNPTTGPASILYSYTLVRDSMSRIIGKTETENGATSTYEYTFDTSGRLTIVTKDGLLLREYAYDQNGNRLTGTSAGAAFVGTYDDQDRLLSYGGKTYSYNANGELTGSTAVGTGANLTYAYNALGRLRSFTATNGSNYRYQQDGEDNLVGIYKDGTLTRRYLYEVENKIAAEVSSQGIVLKEYIYIPGGGAPDYMNFNGSRLRIIKDHLGSPRLVVNSSAGAVVQRIVYSEFGKIIVDTNSCFQPYGFAGGIFDDGSKLLRFGARDYDAETGRWTSKDPILFGGGDTNLYGYVANDPVNWTDPSGLKIAYGDSASRNLLQPLVEALMQSPAGAALVNQLESSSATYTLNATSNGSPGSAFRPVVPGANGTVNVDVCPNVGISTNRGDQLASPLRILAHELGHLTGTRDNGPGRMNNVNGYENPIMTPIDGLIRTSY